MEALVAIVLASNVLQFIDFALKIVRESHEAHLSEASVDTAVLKDLTQRLVDLSTGLNQPLTHGLWPVALNADVQVRRTYSKPLFNNWVRDCIGSSTNSQLNKQT